MTFYYVDPLPHQRARSYFMVPFAGEKKEEFDNKEFYIQSHFDSVKDSIKLFAEDELVCKPGEKEQMEREWGLGRRRRERGVEGGRQRNGGGGEEQKDGGEGRE